MGASSVSTAYADPEILALAIADDLAGPANEDGAMGTRPHS